MKTIEALRSLYENEQLKNGYSGIPVVGYDKFESLTAVLWAGKVPVIAQCLWKPLGSKPSDLHMRVQIPYMPLLACECPKEQKQLLLSANLEQYVLVVKDVGICLNNQGKTCLSVDWQLRKLQRTVTVNEMEVVNHAMWLCSVTNFLFNGLPAAIYVGYPL
jgi:hypothetical protein